MVEGGSSKAFTVIKKMMYAEPQALHALLDKLAKSVTSVSQRADQSRRAVGDDFLTPGRGADRPRLSAVFPLLHA